MMIAAKGGRYLQSELIAWYKQWAAVPYGFGRRFSDCRPPRPTHLWWIERITSGSLARTKMLAYNSLRLPRALPGYYRMHRIGFSSG